MCSSQTRRRSSASTCSKLGPLLATVQTCRSRHTSRMKTMLIKSAAPRLVNFTLDKHGLSNLPHQNPGVKAPARERPCLEHVQLHLRLSVAPFLSLVSLKGRIPRKPLKEVYSLALALPNGIDQASYPISMVFEICHPKTAGTNTLIWERPCLDNLLFSRF